MSESEPIIRLENMHKAFDGVQVLKGLDLDVHAGRTTVVIGPSGCGKSVLLKHMVGLIRPDRGRVLFDGREISSMRHRELSDIRQRMGFLFQGAALFDSMTVEQNICFPLEEHGIGTRQDRRDRCDEVLALVGLEGMQNRMPEDLSGGEKKRVGLARAIATGPEVIFYDEPTTGLDPMRADLIDELILRLQRVLGATAVVVTHDLRSARKVGDRVLMLHQGRFIADTTPRALESVENETVARFVEGRAGAEELARLDRGSLHNSLDTAEEKTT